MLRAGLRQPAAGAAGAASPRGANLVTEIGHDVMMAPLEGAKWSTQNKRKTGRCFGWRFPFDEKCGIITLIQRESPGNKTIRRAEKQPPRETAGFEREPYHFMGCRYGWVRVCSTCNWVPLCRLGWPAPCRLNKTPREATFEQQS